MIQIKFDDDKLSFCLEEALYSEAVIHKCFYWYLDNYSFDFSLLNGLYRINLKSKNSVKFDEEELIFRIKNDLTDFKLREIISAETQNIRELIIAKALSNYEEEEIISTIITDPVGFDPKSII